MEINKRRNWPVLQSTATQIRYLINHTPSPKRVTVLQDALLYVSKINYEYGYRYEKKLAQGIDKKTYPKLTLNSETVILFETLYCENKHTGCTYSSLLCDVINVYCDYIIRTQLNKQKKLI